MLPLAIRKLAIFGVGLIGGSFAAALKQAGCVDRVIGVGRSRVNLSRALERGLIDEVAEEAHTAVADADLVVVAVPVQQTERVLAAIGPHLSEGCAITDGGSTKQDVVAAARRTLGDRLPQFVPAHPIAGAERSGAEAASAQLYRDRLVVLTPLPETDARMVSLVEAAWRQCGARLATMTPQRHDQVFAAVSHLPHAVAFALVHAIASRPDGEELFSYAGAGFRDFTRIAGSSPEMWRDICLANREALLGEIRCYQGALAELADHVRAGDAAALEGIFASARDARARWLRPVKGG